VNIGVAVDSVEEMVGLGVPKTALGIGWETLSHSATSGATCFDKPKRAGLLPLTSSAIWAKKAKASVARIVKMRLGVKMLLVVPDTIYLGGEDFGSGIKGIVCTITVFPALIVANLISCEDFDSVGGMKFDNASPVIWNGCTSFSLCKSLGCVTIAREPWR